MDRPAPQQRLRTRIHPKENPLLPPTHIPPTPKRSCLKSSFRWIIILYCSISVLTLTTALFARLHHGIYFISSDFYFFYIKKMSSRTPLGFPPRYVLKSPKTLDHLFDPPAPHKFRTLLLAKPNHPTQRIPNRLPLDSRRRTSGGSFDTMGIPMERSPFYIAPTHPPNLI